MLEMDSLVLADTTSRSPVFVLQWHLTARCPLNCMHCYIGRQDESYWHEIQHELDHEACLRVIDDFDATFRQWGMPIRINFTGGDPLLREDIVDLIQYASDKGIRTGILGNPNLLDAEMARRLKTAGLGTYQMSLDGLRETHDSLRRHDGLFDDTIRAVHTLREAGIPPVIMYTVHRMNAHELVDVIRLVDRENVALFDFARLVPEGNGKALEDQMLSPEEFRSLLLNVFDEYRRLAGQDSQTKFGRKEHLWKLLYQELGLLKLPPNPEQKIYGGCAVGASILTVLADGRVLACRRLPVEVGHVPEQSLEEIFLTSTSLNNLREVELMEKCSQCDLLMYCRGCPGIPYATQGNYLAPDPQCWKTVNLEGSSV